MVEVKKLEKSQVEVSLSIAWKEWKKEIDAVIQDASKTLKVPGFRSGKIPAHIVEQKIGKENILHEASQNAIGKAWTKAIEDEKIDAIGAPKADIKKLAEGNDLEFTITVAVMPEVELDQSWKKKASEVNKKKASAKKIEKKDVDAELKKLQESRASLVTVNRAAKKDDSVQIDFQVLVDNVPIEGGTSKNHDLILGSGVFIPGFEDGMVGMKASEEKDLTLTFPKDYHAKHLAGKEGVFKVKLNAVQERQMPKLDDDFAVALGKFKTLEEFKKNIQEGMQHEAENKAEEEHRNTLMEELIAVATIDVPQVMIDEEIKQMIAQFEGQVQMMGMTFDDYLVQVKKKREDLEKEWAPQAEKKVQSLLILREIAKQENVKAEAKEVESEMNKMMAQYKNVKDVEKNIDLKKLYAYSESILVNNKVMEILEKL